MKRILPLLTLTVSALFASCNGIDFVYTDLHKWELSKNVKACNVACYNAKSEDGEVIKGNPYWAGTFIFSKSGYLESAATYDEEGEQTGKMTSVFEKGYPVRKTWKGDEAFTRKCNYVYDKDHHITNYKLTDADGNTYEEDLTWEDDELVKGKTTYTYGDDEIKNTINCTYNDDGSYRLESYSDDADMPEVSVEFNADHRMTLKKSEGSKTCKVKYNEKGLVERCENGWSNLDCIEGFTIANFDDINKTYEYEYDDHNNWVKRTTFNDEGEAEVIIVRTIEY